MLQNSIYKIANALVRMEGSESFLFETNAVGGGEWSLETYFWNEIGEKQFVTELVGSNGTWDEEADDLYSVFWSYVEAAKGLNSIRLGGGFIAK